MFCNEFVFVSICVKEIREHLRYCCEYVIQATEVRSKKS